MMLPDVHQPFGNAMHLVLGLLLQGTVAAVCVAG